MAQEQATLAAPVGFQPSLSDRPWHVRALINSWRFMIRKPLGGIGVIIIALVSFAAIFSDTIDRYDPDQAFVTDKPPCTPAQAAEDPPKTPCLDLELKAKVDDNPILKIDGTVKDQNRLIAGQRVQFLEDPSGDHWLGTDPAGRDIYSRTIHGTQLALIVGLGASLVAVLIGTTFGLLSAYFGGAVDMLIQRIVDSFQAFPPFILLLLFTQVVEDPNKWFMAFALGLLGIATVTRVVRSSVLTTREEVYVVAARTVGASDGRIMARHILPNIFSSIIVIFTSAIGAYILAEAGLSFVGLGALDAISWGKMIEDGRRLGAGDPGYALFVGSALTITVLGFNLAGDALRDVLDPRLRGRGGRAGF